MKTKKLLALLLTGAMTATLLAGCGSSNNNADGGAADSGADAAQSDLAYVQDKGTLVVGITEFEPTQAVNGSALTPTLPRPLPRVLA